MGRLFCRARQFLQKGHTTLSKMAPKRGKRQREGYNWGQEADKEREPRWHSKGERGEERGIIGNKKHIRKGAKIGKAIHQTYVLGLTWLSVVVCVICITMVCFDL